MIFVGQLDPMDLALVINVLVTPKELQDGAAEITGDVYRHFFRSRRTQVGARLRAVDGLGHARYGEVVDVDSRRAQLRLNEAAPSLEPRVRLTLYVAAIRPERASTLVEKVTEIGAHEVSFFVAERSQRPLSDSHVDRLKRVARSALEQSGRSWWPEVSTVDFDEVCRAVAESPAVVLSPDADASLVSRPTTDPAEPRMVAVLGPEGGLSGIEKDRLVELGARPMALGPTVLRTETAAIVTSFVLLASS